MFVVNDCHSQMITECSYSGGLQFLTEECWGVTGEEVVEVVEAGAGVVQHSSLSDDGGKVITRQSSYCFRD